MAWRVVRGRYLQLTADVCLRRSARSSTRRLAELPQQPAALKRPRQADDAPPAVPERRLEPIPPEQFYPSPAQVLHDAGRQDE